VTTPTAKILDLGLRVGDMLLSSGAGAADVTATMLAVTRAGGLRGADVDVTFTRLSLSHQASSDEPATVALRSVGRRVIDYEDLTLVDHLVGDLLAERIDVDEAHSRLARIVSSGHRRPRWAVTLGWGVMGGAVGALVGGITLVPVIAFVVAAGIDLLQRSLYRRRLPVFYQQVAGGMLATLVAVATAAAHLHVNRSLVVTAGIVMLLAGIGLMGAIQDALSGFHITGSARILEALLATGGIIARVSGGLAIGGWFGVDLGVLVPGALGLADLPARTLAAAVTAAAFAFASYAPLRALLGIAAVAALGEAIYGFANLQDVGVAWASAVAAVAIGLVSFFVAERVRVPPLVVVVSAVVPLLPGLSIYRGLSLIADGGDGILPMFNAAAIAISLAAGVILGEYAAQPLHRTARRVESRLAGPRLVGPRTPRKQRP